jgi:hypothetical protein
MVALRLRVILLARIFHIYRVDRPENRGDRKMKTITINTKDGQIKIYFTTASYEDLAGFILVLLDAGYTTFTIE